MSAIERVLVAGGVLAVLALILLPVSVWIVVLFAEVSW